MSFPPLSKTLPLILVIILFFAGYYYLNAKSSAPPPASEIKYSASEIQSVIATGNLQPTGSVSLYANTTGRITKLYVRNGSQIVKGQKIAEIQSVVTEEQTLLSKASYQEALIRYQNTATQKQTLQAQLESARKAVIDAANAENAMQDRMNTSRRNPTTGKEYTMEEVDSIRSATVSARQLFSAAEKTYRDADSTINNSQTALALARLNLDSTKDATLKATADGTLLNFTIQEGDLVQAGSADLPSSFKPLGVITDLSRYSLKVQVNETRISYVKPGQSAQIKFDSQKETTYSGVVQAVDSIGTLTQGLVTYTVLISPQQLLPETIKPGMTAEVEILVR